MSTLALLAQLLAAQVVDPAVDSQPVRIIAVTAGGIAAIITAVSLVLGVRNRRSAEAELVAPDPENNLGIIRERVRSLESRQDAYSEHKLPDRVTRTETLLGEVTRRVDDLEDEMNLRRASDIVIESEGSPRGRRRRAQQ